VVTPEYLLADPFLEAVRTFVLETGKFNIADVQSKFRVGCRRALFLRNALIQDGTLDPLETDGQNWLSGSLVLVKNEDELQMALEKIVSIVGADGSRDFEKLVGIIDNERVYVMRLVIRAGVKSLLSLLG
jgi:DNA segregation ATPase FtsK/SpoIIIE-like protein